MLMVTVHVCLGADSVCLWMRIVIIHMESLLRIKGGTLNNHVRIIVKPRAVWCPSLTRDAWSLDLRVAVQSLWRAATYRADCDMCV